MSTPIPTTIIAPATPATPSAIGLVRLSGPAALDIVAPFFQGTQPLLKANPRTAYFGRLHEPTGEVLDEVLVTYFKAPHSYTQEDVIEISCHGSPYILTRIVELLTQAGATPALPGEFTQRAFLNGALDLTQAEAVADLIAAETQAEQRLAMTHLRGGISNRLAELRQQLVQATGLLELELDFSEEDVAFADRTALADLIQAIETEVAQLLDSFASGQAVKGGIPVVLTGKPNAGKSTLLNQLLAEDRAIVSPIPGTTRDVIEDRITLGGYSFRLIDTAGLREATNALEAEGIARSQAQLKQAGIVLYLFDLTTETLPEAQAAVAQLPISAGTAVGYLGNKLDALSSSNLPGASPAASTSTSPHTLHHTPNTFSLSLSAATGEGVEALREALLAHAQDLNPGHVVVTQRRHADALTRAQAALTTLLANVNAQAPTELLAVDVHHVLAPLGEITGEITTDEILGGIFAKFCIGK